LVSGQDVSEVVVAAGARPAERVAAVKVIEDERVGSEFEQGGHGVAVPGLRGEVDGGDALAVA